MIRVNDNYIIELDCLSCTVKRDLHQTIKAKNRVTGETFDKPSFQTVGYYSTIPGAIKAIIKDMNIRELSEGVHTLEEAVKVIQENNKQFCELLEKATEV